MSFFIRICFGIPLYDLLLVADKFGVRDVILGIISPQSRSSELPDRICKNNNSIAVYTLNNDLSHKIDILSDDQLSAILDALSNDEQQLLTGYRSLNKQGKEYMFQTLDMASRVYIKSDDLPNVEDHLG